MVRSYPQRDILSSGSAASDWCNQPEALQSFWPYPGNAKGIAEAIAARGAVDLSRREETANCIRRQYAEVGIKPPEGLTAFAQGAEVVTVGHQLQARWSGLFSLQNFVGIAMGGATSGHRHPGDSGVLDGVRRPRFRRNLSDACAGRVFV